MPTVSRCNASSANQVKPKPRVKKTPRDAIVVVQEAARVGNARFQHYVETGKLLRSE